MTLQTIPLSATPSQLSRVSLGGQPCTIKVYQKSTGLYLDLLVSDKPVITGRLCHNANRLVRDEYLGFVGDLMFVDTAGSSDPDSTGLGGRFILTYMAL